MLVRDIKHSGEKLGNNGWCGRVPEAEAFARAMPEVAGLRGRQSLKCYTQLREVRDKHAGWKWRAVVTRDGTPSGPDQYP